MGHIGMRYGSYRRAERPFLAGETGRFGAVLGCLGGCESCTIGLIRLISPIRPISWQLHTHAARIRGQMAIVFKFAEIQGAERPDF